MSEGTRYWRWRLIGDHPAAHRIPPWPMTEASAAEWSARWGCNVEKIEGSEFVTKGPAHAGPKGNRSEDLVSPDKKAMPDKIRAKAEKTKKS